MSITPLPPIVGVPGLDIYHGDSPNGTADGIQFHSLAAAGFQFVYLKASQGLTSTDPLFKAWWPRARAAGLIRGAYHFFDPDADPVAQADHLMAQADLESGDLPFCLDVETDGQHVGANALKAAEHIKKETGYWPWIYASDSFYQDRLKGYFTEGLHTLWIARYGHAPATRYDCWQYSEEGRTPSISHALDLDVFAGTFEELQAKCVK